MGKALPPNKLIGMCHCMGSQSHDRIESNGAALSGIFNRGTGKVWNNFNKSKKKKKDNNNNNNNFFIVSFFFFVTHCYAPILGEILLISGPLTTLVM